MDHIEAGRYWEANAEVWTQLSRQGYDACRDFVNTPAFMGNLPDVSGLRGVDIGCGEGTNTRQVAWRGAEMTALDYSPTFLHHAAATEREDPLGISYLRASAVELPFADDTFDFATSFMCLMDLPETERVLAEAYRVIKPGGFLQFSITHPCYDLPNRRKIRDAEGRACGYELGGYFERTEGDILEWIFSAAPAEVREGLRRFQTPVFRRTLSEWLNMIVKVGFALEYVCEPVPDDEVLQQRPDLDDMRVIAFFIQFRCRK
jgi:ubiquinone/menaquinone biosynthesis C-methylase UbiE